MSAPWRKYCRSRGAYQLARFRILSRHSALGEAEGGRRVRQALSDDGIPVGPCSPRRDYPIRSEPAKARCGKVAQRQIIDDAALALMRGREPSGWGGEASDQDAQGSGREGQERRIQAHSDCRHRLSRHHRGGALKREGRSAGHAEVQAVREARRLRRNASTTISSEVSMAYRRLNFCAILASIIFTRSPDM